MQPSSSLPLGNDVLTEELKDELKDFVNKAIAFYLENYNSPMLAYLSNESEDCFSCNNSQDKIALRKFFDICTARILLSEVELLKKAAELSTNSIEEIIRKGGKKEAEEIILQYARRANAKDPNQFQYSFQYDFAQLDKEYNAIQEEVAKGRYKPKRGIPMISTLAKRANLPVEKVKSWVDYKKRSEFLIPPATEYTITKHLLPL